MTDDTNKFDKVTVTLTIKKASAVKNTVSGSLSYVGTGATTRGKDIIVTATHGTPVLICFKIAEMSPVIPFTYESLYQFPVGSEPKTQDVEVTFSPPFFHIEHSDQVLIYENWTAEKVSKKFREYIVELPPYSIGGFDLNNGPRGKKIDYEIKFKATGTVSSIWFFPRTIPFDCVYDPYIENENCNPV